MRVSVCVPFRDAAPYLERCARALLNQTHENLQLVFVDDGSVDGGADVIRRVLQDYPSRKNDVCILRHENSMGAMTARKEGFLASDGELMAFCDADDWIDSDYCARMSAAAADADMVFALMVRNEDDPMGGGIFPFDGTGFDYMDLVGKVTAFGSMVNKVYRRELLSEDLFRHCQGLRIGEDKCFNALILPKCRRVMSVCGPRYHYRVNQSSVSQRFDPRRVVDDLERVWSIMDDALPEDVGLAMRKQHLRNIVFLGMKFGVLSRSKCRMWLDRLLRLKAVPWPEDTNFRHWTVLFLAKTSYDFAFLFCRLLGSKGHAGL